MKKVLAMVLVAVMTLLAIPSLAEPKLGCWTLQYYVDEFDDPTDEFFLLHNEAFFGDGKTVGLAQMFVSGSTIGFRLFEEFDITTGSLKAVVINSSIFEKLYTISFKDSRGEKYSYTGTAASGESQILLTQFTNELLLQETAFRKMEETCAAIYDMLINGGDIQVVIASNDGKSKYKFTLEGNSSFAEVYPFEEIYRFYEGLAGVRQSSYMKSGYIDKTGKLVIPCEWDSASVFSEGLAEVQKDGKWGYIDKTGKLVIPCEWDWADGFSEGLALVQKDKKWGYIDKTGKLVIPCEWDWIKGDFYEGLTLVRQDDKYGFIDKTGKIVIPCEWDDACGFSDGLAAVQKDKKWGFIDKTGKLVIPCEWNNAAKNFEFCEGLAAVRKDEWGYIDKTGKIVIPCEWEEAEDFSDGWARVRKDQKWGYIDKTGKLVIPCEWDKIYGFSEGLALVQKDKKWGYIDKTGKLVIPYEWDGAYGFSEGLAAVQKDGKWGYIDKTGSLVIPCVFSYANSFKDGVASVKKGNRAMLIDSKGNVILQ